MHQSGDHPPVCIPAQLRHPIRSISSVQSYLRSDLTADFRTSPVPAIFHFYFHFYYFHSISFHIDVREIYEVQCVLYDTLRPAPNLSNIHIIFYIFHPFCIHPSYIPCISSVYFFCVSRRAFRHPFRSTSSVISYLRYNLTADSRTSPVPAILHFYSLFYYIPFHSILCCSRDLPYIYGHISLLSRVTRNGSHKCF